MDNTCPVGTLFFPDIPWELWSAQAAVEEDGVLPRSGFSSLWWKITNNSNCFSFIGKVLFLSSLLRVWGSVHFLIGYFVLFIGEFWEYSIYSILFFFVFSLWKFDYKVSFNEFLWSYWEFTKILEYLSLYLLIIRGYLQPLFLSVFFSPLFNFPSRLWRHECEKFLYISIGPLGSIWALL